MITPLICRSGCIGIITIINYTFLSIYIRRFSLYIQYNKKQSHSKNMQIFTQTPDEYVSALPPERVEVISKLRSVIQENIPEGFEEMMSYGMIGYVVPHSLYPAGYHCDPKLPLPFIAIASQKNSVNLYHMGINVEP